MKLEVVTMTPEWARQILETQNTSNRHLKMGVVARYANAIASGQWQLTQQGIAIGADGVLLDGQHRLAAIVAAQQSVQICLATDCDPKIFTVIDTGSARTAADILQLTGSSNATSVAAGLKLYVLNDRVPHLVWTSRGEYTPSHDDLVLLYERRKDESDWAGTLARTAYGQCRKLRAAPMVAFILMAFDAGYGKHELEQFLYRLSSGAELFPGSPSLVFRSAIINGLLKTAKSTKSSQSQTFLAALIKVFNYEIEGVKLKMFKLPPAPPMPQIIGAY